jgi:hypothetical protein
MLWEVGSGVAGNMKTTIMNIMYIEATKATGALMRPRLNGPGVYNSPLLFDL